MVQLLRVLLLGTAAGSFTHSSTGMIAGGLAGGVIGLAADSLVLLNVDTPSDDGCTK